MLSGTMESLNTDWEKQHDIPFPRRTAASVHPSAISVPPRLCAHDAASVAELNNVLPPVGLSHAAGAGAQV